MQHTAESSAPEWARWGAVVQKIQAEDPSGAEDLYLALAGFRRFFSCQLGATEGEDALHDIFLVIYQAVLKRAIHDPDRLMGFARTVAQRQVSGRIPGMVRARQCCDCEDVVLRDGSPNPEQAAIDRQRIELMRRSLAGMTPPERQILLRTIQGQPNGRIVREMGFTEARFRNLKSRAKHRLTERLSRTLSRCPCAPR